MTAALVFLWVVWGFAGWAAEGIRCKHPLSPEPMFEKSDFYRGLPLCLILGPIAMLTTVIYYIKDGKAGSKK